MNKDTFKSIGAVVGGFVTVFVLSVGTDTVLEKLGIFPSPSEGLFITWMLVLATVYRTIYTIAGGYVTAALAPDRPMRLTKILGIIGFVAATLGLITTWDKGLGPHWYPIALVVLAYPSVWLGGKLKVKFTSQTF